MSKQLRVWVMDGVVEEIRHHCEAFICLRLGVPSSPVQCHCEIVELLGVGNLRGASE
jgi:hypothetical protein